MNLQVFLFKLSMSIYYVLRLSLMFAPLTVLLVFSKQGGWKYGFTFIQNSLSVGLFMAFALGFMLGMYHVLSYELVGKSPLKNYLRSHQQVRLASQASLAALKDRIKSDDRNSISQEGEDFISFNRKVIFSQPDKVRISKDQEGFLIESRPYYKWWFIDFGRNLKHVKLFAKQIEQA